MKKAIILIIILFNLLYTYQSYAEDKNTIEPPTQRKQKEADTKVKPETTNEEKDQHQTLSSLRTKQK
ncbi:hypothetical protein DS62_09950, partial [Smithella sp. SC_K08D17]